MRKQIMAAVGAAVLTVSLCVSGIYASESAAPGAEPVLLQDTEITVFAAKSLNTVMEKLIEEYNTVQPGIKITGSYDSSGTLMTQIEEGAACDVFFSAAQTQMNELE